MKIVSITVVRNEADIIEAFVRHHLQIVDRMIIADHLSVDATTAILAEIKAEGAPLDVKRESRPDFFHTEIMTQLMRCAAREFGADWVLPLDGDEFLITSRGPRVRPELEKLSQETAFRLPWRTYIPRPEDPVDAASLFERIQYRRSEEPCPFHKILVPGSLARRETIALHAGSHCLVHRSGWKRRKIKGEDAPGLFLAHFPVRSAAQLTTKALLGWPARLASPEQKGKKNWHLKEIFCRLRSGSDLTAKDAMEIALSYAVPDDVEHPPLTLIHDPVTSPSGSLCLKHREICPVNPLSALANLAEGLAAELALERKRIRLLPARLKKRAYNL